MLNLLRSWLRRRKQPSLNLLYERLQELRVPPGEPDRSVYQQMNLGVIELMRQSKDAGLQADLFRIMLDEIVAECQLPTVSLERLNLEKASGTDWTSEMELRHWAIPLLIQSFARLLIEKGGPNFNELPRRKRTGYQSQKRLRKDSIAHLGVTSDSHSPDFAHIGRSCLHLQACLPY